MEWGLFNYFPEAHYTKAISQALREQGDELVSDGGFFHDEPSETVYMWYDPETNAVVQEEVTPGLWAGLFDQQEEAIHFMEEYQQTHDLEYIRYELYRTEMEKIGIGDTILEQG